MKKIFLVLNGANTANTIAFACYIAGFSKARLIGVFPGAYSTEPVLKQVLGMAYVESNINGDLPVKKLQQQLFEDICESKGVPYRVFKEQRITAEEMIAESRLADLIIIDTIADSQYQTEVVRNKLTRSLLTNAECPVMISPAFFKPIEEIVFCYDGSASAVFAMKQLSYLLPGLEDVKAIALQIGDVDKQKATENNRLREWLCGNYRYSDVITIKGTPDKELFNFLLKKKHTLVVLGAYGRSMISRFFHQSHADQLIETLPFPVFVTHY
ncbi:Universal stress protein family protein [Chitinophaga sp. CF118]|uniref:universal stress protein n=1 Tax=Chitinophaga sp. CF118 TaxID=1884367 RepID=UPI0008F12574|nr:universal stress protein [Chitinophaga sp. CF118]SFD83171.1 Universal stress protein family protein [Chitinophaga sp. CF118]